MIETVVVDAVRSPIGRSGWKGMEKKGYYCNSSAQDMIASVMSQLIERVKKKSSKFDPGEIEDVIVGCLSQIGEQGGNIGRIGGLLAGIPVTSAGVTVNRYCNAGLQAINWAAMSIMTGAGDITIGAGVENMSHYRMGSDMQVAMEANLPVMISSRFGEIGMMTPQGVSAELVADKYDLTREDMDKFGLWSHQKATKAMREGVFKSRIVPMEIKRDGETLTVDTDETIRPICLDDPETSLQKMGTLQPRFRAENGRVTAGNSSQIVDGAAAVILMSRKKADELGIEPMARVVSTAVAGDDPTIMLLGPIPAMKKALARAGATIEEMDVIEPNEAFASPCLAFAKEFKYAFDDPRVNPTGGAIALGHPIGASGVIYFTEMVHELVRCDLKYGIQTLCGGGGVGIATVVKREV